ncbi:9416_t:CDS:10 [Diversispora eburnea]|uniref:9416_t:CDS:1 n=1 Tax=Diversispora eburnea TaxID=1213867 RepID=A0A9N8W4Z5_9GLOM|nr:9416_t:CDS:10 [Diversispora eburnea]
MNPNIPTSNINTSTTTSSKQEPKGYVIYNANVYTSDNKIPRIDSFTVLNGKFIDIGSQTDLLKKWNNLQHLLGLGDILTSVNLSNTRSIEDVIEQVKKYIQLHPDDTNEWVTGFGWNQELWQSKEFPTSKDLDSDPQLNKYPIALTRIDGHAMWVNEKVLNILGKDKIPENIDGGEIGRNKLTNELTGIFVDNAMELVFDKMLSPTDDKLLNRLRAAIHEMHSNGLTGIHDASVPPKYIDFYKRTIKNNPEEFNIRVYAMVECDRNKYCGDQVERIDEFGEGRLTVRSVKLFMDGALGSWGAALLEPYSGDQANNIIINAYEKCFQDYIKLHSNDEEKKILTEEELLRQVKNLAEKLRFRIEHAQILTLDDIKRVGELKIIPSMQPTHGSERIKGAYAWLKVFPLSSDFPVESVNPFLGFYAAITRKWKNGDSPHGKDGWFPSQKLTREEALRGFTIDAAYAGFSEDTMGSISIGKYADFVILDRDIMQTSEEKIIDTKVLSTIFAGKVKMILI